MHDRMEQDYRQPFVPPGLYEQRYLDEWLWQ